jgi:hypothetical protein
MCTSLRAELPPGTYEKLKKEAQEVLQLRITKVTQSEEGEPDIPRFICDAQILAVERSKAGHKKGDEIRFHSYHVTEKALRQGFAGPQSPPLLKAGWTGRVYLNAMEGEEELDLAAYGQSFEPTKKTRPRRRWRFRR